MNTEFTVLIPARYTSRRLPGKPLADIAGKTMIERVVDAAKNSGAARVAVATDDGRIADAVQSFGGEVCITSTHHASGTDRIHEAAASLKLNADEVVVNLQGDEPLMPPAVIAQVAARLLEVDSAMSSAEEELRAEDVDNPNVVKVATDDDGLAMDFTRKATRAMRRYLEIGGVEESGGFVGYGRHIGLYAYRVSYLRKFTALGESHREQQEHLEQLRALDNGDKIAMVRACEPCGVSVDTPQQLETVRNIFAGR